MAEFSNVQVLYQLTWEGKLEHPHMITVQYPASQDGLRLRDVKKRLTTLRGRGIGHSFSWSYKRNYRSTFIWNDLSDDDVIHPLKGSGEYLLKGSELIDAFASKNSGAFTADKPVEPARIERKERFDNSRHSRTMSVDGGHQLPPELSVEQETIDVEKSDEFCLSSSSDNEVSPRIPSNLVVVTTKSPTVQGLQTTAHSEQVPFSPGSAKRLWKREIKKSLFRTRNTASSGPSKIENAALQGDSGPEDASLWKESRSKSVNTLDLKEKAETVEQSTSQLIRLLWARWTGGSSRSKRIPSASNTESPCKEERFAVTVEEIAAVQEELSNPVPRASEEVEKEIVVAVETELKNADGPLELKKNRPTLIVPELQVVLESCETPGGGPPEAEIETPKPAIASADFKTSHGLPKVRTTVTSPRPLPPGFHKGTNDTKPVQTTPRRSSFRNSIPLASPPLRRSFSRDAARSLAIAGSPEQSDSVASTPSPQKPVKKCINFHERDERPLTPGLTALDWEKALQAAVADCLPPPNFRQILQECSTCGRTFKPDSLEVHRRGCHPPQYARAFSARASPHMIRSRAL